MATFHIVTGLIWAFFLQTAKKLCIFLPGLQFFYTVGKKNS